MGDLFLLPKFKTLYDFQASLVGIWQKRMRFRKVQYFADFLKGY